MRVCIVHESSTKIRFQTGVRRMSVEQADILDYFLQQLRFVKGTGIRQRTASFTVSYSGDPEDRRKLLSALEDFSFYDEEAKALVPEQTGRELNNSYEERLVLKVLGRIGRKIFLPVPMQCAWTVFRSLGYVRRGISCLAKGRLQVPVLDAAAITASMLTGDFDTAGSVMFLLDAGEILEDWTYQKSVGDLARSMSLKVDRVWVRPEEGPDYLANLSDVKEGDTIVIRSSDVVPLDGSVVSGELTVNQSSLTGESVPVAKTAGGYVYAGTVVEEGEAAVHVTRTSGSGKYDRIVKMIEESEKLKSSTEAKAFHLADSLVPYSFAGAALTFLLTRNVQRAMSFLMVDFSCALKLSMPLSVLSSIREAGEQNISVKGGRFLENYSEAKTILFDKTGTLTHAAPHLFRVIPFNGMSEKECLRLAACLEEHFPHSMARAVVEAAERQGIDHEERHSVVNYVVAHGISSSVDGTPVLIGSYHFIFEDEKCRIPEGKQELFDSLPDEYSHLYLASWASCRRHPLRCCTTARRSLRV
ncbi:MAG: HAD-IC family P-type ATPase [Firmicutes bacterium]|nr:HAD-IC family P-type ATPase [Bacillota bacterium]